MPYSSRGRGVVTVAYAVTYALIALSYIVAPPARTARPGTVSVSRYIDQLGPVWTLGFGLVAIALVGTVVWRRWQWIAHSLAAALIAGYGAASLLSGFLSTATYGSPLGVVCLATTVTHFVLARTYQVQAAGGLRR